MDVVCTLSGEVLDKSVPFGISQLPKLSTYTGELIGMEYLMQQTIEPAEEELNVEDGEDVDEGFAEVFSDHTIHPIEVDRPRLPEQVERLEFSESEHLASEIEEEESDNSQQQSTLDRLGRPGMDAIHNLGDKLLELKGPITTSQEEQLRELAAQLNPMDQRLQFSKKHTPQKCGVFHAKGTRKRLFLHAGTTALSPDVHRISEVVCIKLLARLTTPKKQKLTYVLHRYSEIKAVLNNSLLNTLISLPPINMAWQHSPTGIPTLTRRMIFVMSLHKVSLHLAEIRQKTQSRLRLNRR